MGTDISVTRWLSRLAEGDHTAADRLWDFVQHRLHALARRKIGSRTLGFDEEDVANSAFMSLCQGIEGGKFASLADRNEVWRLLAVITINKATKKTRDANRSKRGGDFNQKATKMLDGIPSGELPPDMELACKQECARLLSLLESEDVKMVAMLKVEGYKNSEIAERLNCAYRTVLRRVSLIREIWSHEQ